MFPSPFLSWSLPFFFLAWVFLVRCLPALCAVAKARGYLPSSSKPPLLRRDCHLSPWTRSLSLAKTKQKQLPLPSVSGPWPQSQNSSAPPPLTLFVLKGSEPPQGLMGWWSSLLLIFAAAVLWCRKKSNTQCVAICKHIHSEHGKKTVRYVAG